MEPQDPTPPPTEPTGPDGGTSVLRNPLVRVGAVVALAIAAGLIAWLLIGNSDSSSSATPTTTESTTTVAQTGPVNLSADGLKTLAGAVGQLSTGPARSRR